MSEQNVEVAQDPIAVDAKHYSVEFENDKVRVLRIKYGPRETCPSRIPCQAATGSWTSSLQWETQRT